MNGCRPAYRPRLHHSSSPGLPAIQLSETTVVSSISSVGNPGDLRRERYLGAEETKG